MKPSGLFRVFIFLTVILSACTAKADSSELTSILISHQADFQEKLAAKEIRRYIYLRTGKLLPVHEASSLPNTKNIIIIANKSQPVLKNISLESIKKLQADEYILKTFNKNGKRNVLICGGDSTGTLYGAYRFIEHFGVRFYLHGDVIPDTKTALKIPDLDEQAKPLFRLRGIQPFHDFPEGPDWWEKEDYKAVISQLPKLRMNFIGFHTYPEGHPHAEPMVWIGLEKDIDSKGNVKFSYPSTYANTLRDNKWGYAPLMTSNFTVGASLLFDRDAYGPKHLRGHLPFPETPEAMNEVFNATGKMLRESFTLARLLGVKTCVGTETALKIPKLVRQRLKQSGMDPASPEARRKLYKGIFQRIQRLHPLDYYWFWTPEKWIFGSANPQNVQAAMDDLKCAIEVWKELKPEFNLATCGWTLGPPENLTGFDRILPKNAALSSINRDLGFQPVVMDFAKLKHRSTWAIPWLEDDPAMINPQLWAGRMRRDAADAYAYGCDGLMGIHWRTRELSPQIAALARAAWDQKHWNPDWNTQFNSSDLPSRKAPSDKTKSRDLPIADFYDDWAYTQFGPEAAKELAVMFNRLDGGPLAKNRNDRRANLPRPSDWIRGGPGGIVVNSKPWEQVKAEHAFVDEMAELRPRIQARGNLDRFDYWLNTFRYNRYLAQLGCLRGQLDTVMDTLKKEQDPKLRKDLARNKALLLRIQLARLWEEMMTCQLQRTTNVGEMGTIANLEQHSRIRLHFLGKHDDDLQNILGQSLSSDAQPTLSYKGPARLFVPTIRPSLQADETLNLKVILLDSQTPNEAAIYYRPLGRKTFNTKPLTHIARGVYNVELPPMKADFEYYIQAKSSKDKNLTFPATAPEINQTIIILPKNQETCG